MDTTHRYRATALAAVIEAQGRTKEWVAGKGEIHPSLLTHVLAGRRTLGEEAATRIAKALGMPPFLVFELSVASEKVSREMAVA